MSQYIEFLEKKCPRCGKASADKSNPSGRCSSCLKKLRQNKHKPGHWQRAQTKADDALRRQDGKNGTAHHKSSGRGNRAAIVKQVQRAEKKTKQKLSPDRKNNGKGYASSNVRMVPEKLNRGRHKVDGKKLRQWRKKLSKNNIDMDTFKTALLIKTAEKSHILHDAMIKVFIKKTIKNFYENSENLRKASRKQLTQMLGDVGNQPEHIEAVKKIRDLFPNSNHDVWLTRHYRDNPSIFNANMDTLEHISGQMKIHDELRQHDVSKLNFGEGLDSLIKKAEEIAQKKAKEFENHVYRPSSTNFKVMDTSDNRTWFNTGTPSCNTLGLKLGHCGNANSHEDDRVHYLGQEKTDRNHKKYHDNLSSTFIVNNGYVGEMKGPHNFKPSEKDHGAIVEFLSDHPDIKGIIGGGYLPQNNFSVSDLSPELNKKLKDKKPNIDVLDTENELDEDNFPEAFQSTISDHNKAVNLYKKNDKNIDNIVNSYIRGDIKDGELELLLRHANIYKLFSAQHIEDLINNIDKSHSE